MSRKLILAAAAVALQAGVLAFMAAQREWILRTGRTVWLRTAPIDPRDPMRGDYVRLDYEISRVPTNLWNGAAPLPRARHGNLRRDVPVFVRLQNAEDGTVEVVGASDQRPADGLFIRGRTEHAWGGELGLRYGIEALFMQQGKARDLEDQQRDRMRGTPLRVQVALSTDGTAVLKCWQWEPLGLTLELTSTNRPAQFGTRVALIGATLVLKNHGMEDLAVVDLPGNQSFALLNEPGWDTAPPRWAHADDHLPKPRPEDVIRLKPDQSHTNRINLLDSRWFVNDSSSTNGPPRPVPVAELTRGGSAFRFEYRPPPMGECAGLPDEKRIWHGRLKSRRFWAAGAVD
jgi:uncharacterized membrane-anchored protein